jgi:peptidyl-prolyl cis-trans isomerase D
MLLSIRDRTSGWIAYVIVGLLVIPFALFGLYNYVGNGGPQVIATVGDAEITRTQLDQAYQQRQSELRRMLGDQYDPAVFSTDNLRRQVLEQLIDRQALVNYARDNRLRASDADVSQAVRSQSMFQVDGQFSSERYQRLLQQNSLTAEAYESQIRRDLSISLLQRAVQSTPYTSDQAVDRLITLQAQQRELAWVTLPTADYRDAIEVTPADLEAWYDNNREQYREPEQVQLRYLSLSAEAIAPTLEISEQTVRERYDQRASGSGEDAARSVRHILAAVPEDGDEAAVDAARQTIVEARERIRAGESFAAVAEAVSDDSGSAGRGGSLGVIEQSDVADAFAETAWSLQPGELSQPVRTPFGWHLIEVTDVQTADLPPFEQMRASIRETIAMERAERRVTERANTLETLAFENPATLEPAADAAGLSVQSTDWIDASADDTGIAGDPAVLEAAFSDAMLDNRENSDLIELEDGGYAVIRVTDYRSARIRPLDAVRDQAVSAYRDQRANAAARADAQRIADAVNAGESPETAASGIDAAQLNAPVMGGRNDRSLPAGVRERGFRLSGPDGSGDRAGVGRLSTGWAAVVVESVEPGDPAAVSAERRDQLRQTLTDLDGQASVQAVVAALRAQADVEIREGNL